MKVPKKYFHDRIVLALLAVNSALFLLAGLGVLLGIDGDENPTSIIAYRDTSKIGQISGPTSELYQFAVFAIIITVISTLLSLKIYVHRKHLAIGILGLNVFLLVMTILIFSVLTAGQK